MATDSSSKKRNCTDGTAIWASSFQLGEHLPFKELTAELARINRLNRIEDPKVFGEQVDAAAREFFGQYQAFQKSQYARGFKKWAPLYVGWLLSAVMTVVAPHVALS